MANTSSQSERSNRRITAACLELNADPAVVAAFNRKSGGSDAESSLPLKDQMDYAMKHFMFIADQRLRFFQFYAILLAASVGATLTLVEKDYSQISYLITGAYHVLVSLLFTAIEARNLHLLGVARHGLQAIEANPQWPIALRLSTIDSMVTRVGLRGLGSFRVAFRFTYLAQLVFGCSLLYCGAFVQHGKKSSQPEIRRVVLSDGTTFDYFRERRKSPTKDSAVSSPTSTKNATTTPSACQPSSE